VKCFCNIRNIIPYIHDIEIINAFHDRVSDIKTLYEVTMKKHRMVADLLVVIDVCIVAFKAWARLLESHGKGSSKKKQDDREVNTTDLGDHKDHRDRGYHRNRQRQSLDQNEKRHFHRPDDIKKWSKIHHTLGHDLEERKTFLDHKKMLPPAAPVAYWERST
jgi:hypothetical protein